MSSTPRLLHLGKYYFPHMGGIENYLYVLCNHFKTTHPLEVIVANRRGPNVRERVEGVSVTRCAEAAFFASTSLCPSMPLELSGRDYDLIHFHFPDPMGVCAYLLSRKPKRHRVVVTYHSDIVKQMTLLKAYRPLMNRVLDRADAIICTSPNYLESSDQVAPYRHKCRVIPYGIDLNRFDAREEIQDLATKIRNRYTKPLIIGVGRLIYYKGFEYAIRAMRSVDAELLLIGEGPLRQPLEDLAQAEGVSNKVHFLGGIHNNDLAPYYAASEIFAFPSIARSEAFGIVQLEAMALGIPVVNTALDSGVPFVSRHNESGLTVPPGDPEALADAFNRLLKDPTLRRQMGQAARQRVEKEFSNTVMTGRVQDLYAELAR